HHEREQHYAGPAKERRAVAAGREVPGADRDIAVAALERLGEAVEEAGLVLAVGVELDRNRVAVLERPAKAGLERSAHAEIERMAHHRYSVGARHLGRAIARAVVDHEQVV